MKHAVCFFLIAIGLRAQVPTEAEIRKALAGNLCMCTGYVQIVDAVKEAAKQQSTAKV